MTPLVASDLPLSGVTLIEASAGTGKTYTIATLYLRLLLETDLGVDRILVVTYTNAATAELRGRLRVRVQETLRLLEQPAVDEEEDWLARARREHRSRDRLRAALFGFDQAAIFTIHGFCQRALRENAFESGADFDVELIPDESTLIADAVQDAWVAHLHDAEPELLRAVERAGISPGTTAKLLRLRATHAEAEIVPARDEVPQEWLNLAAEVESLRARAWELWQRDQAHIVALLRSEVINRNTYRLTSIARWAIELPRALAVPQLGIQHRFADIHRFSQTAVTIGTKKNCTAPTHPFFEAIDDLLQAETAADERLVQNVELLRRALLHDAEARLRSHKRQARVQSFDDLIHDLATALRRDVAGAALANAIRTRFGAALIDEFQDTDPRQAEIFRRIFADTEPRPPLIFVGDPKQAIYAFRGADVHAYLGARDLAGAQVYTLTVNRRSDPALLRGVNQLYAGCDDPFASPAIRYHEVQARPHAIDAVDASGDRALQILALPAPPKPDGSEATDSPRWNKETARPQITAGVAAEIAALLESDATLRSTADAPPRRLRPADIAVLCRTNDQARLVLRELRRLGIRAVSQGGDSVFATAAAGDIERIVQALASPRDAAVLRTALASSALGISAVELDAMRSESERWEPHVARFHRGHQYWENEGIFRALRSILDAYDVGPRLLAQPGGERHYTDLLHLTELLHTTEAEQRLGIEGLLRWLGEQRRDPATADGAADTALLRMESDDDAVRLVTMHKSKGLEYPVVFCPFLWEGPSSQRAKEPAFVFHDPDSRALLMAVDGGRPGDRELADHEARGEQLRLAYVALTRARHRCYVVWGHVNSSDASPLAHLLGPELASEPLVDLPARMATHAPAIGVRPLAPRRSHPVELSSPRAESLQPRQLSRKVSSATTLTSFSSLLASGVQGAGDERAADRDAGVLDPSLVTVPVAPVAPETRTLALDDLPGGARTGDLIHSIFENLDFTAPAEEFDKVIGQQLMHHGFPVERWRGPLSQAFVDWLHTPLPHDFGTLRLSQLSAGERIAELEFLLPAARAEDDAPVRMSHLADIFREHAACGADGGWPDRIARLRAGEWRGFLRGFVDLIFRHGGRWYIVDYKSNHLGSQAPHYTRPHLLEAMHEHLYFLQYHLYCLALVRHLRRRLPAFDYERDFGGVFYLFVRGMHPDHAPGTGVFWDRPSKDLIDALDAAFGGGAR